MADMRIGGLASGMDIDSIVSDLMKAERIPLNKLKQEKQLLEWKRDDYRSINTLLLDFRSELTNMKLTTNYRARSVQSSNEDKVTATASSAASQSSYNIKSVSQLASAAILKNGGAISQSTTDKLDATKGLHAQSSKLNASTFQWGTGIVESKKVTASADNEVVDLNLGDGISISNMNAVSIKVNGKSYKVVETSTSTTPQEGEVVVDVAGKLTFQDGVIKKGATISAEYVVDNKTETPAATTDTITEWQLKKDSIHQDTFSLSVGTATYEIDGTVTENPNEFRLVSTTDGTVSIGKINTETGKISFDTDKPQVTADLSVNYQQNYTSFSLGAHTSNGETYENFVITGRESLNNVVNEVNNSNVGLTMFYDSYSDQITFTRKETGNFNGSSPNEENENDPNDINRITDIDANKEIIFSGTFLTEALRFDADSEETGGENLKLTINELNTQRTSNTFEMGGVNFNVKQTFTETEGSASLTVNNDSEAVFDNIKNFVETYNTLIAAINQKVTEDRYRDYKPLTDEQRESLSDKQQEQWEDRAKSGLLKGDSTLSSALSSMRTDFYTSVSNDKVSNVYNQLATLGITTSSNYLEGGKLEINDAKLKKAIEDDPESVENLFRGSGDSYGEKGIVQRLYDTVNSTMDKIHERAGKATYTNQQFTIGRNLRDVDSQISRFEDRLIQVEDRYWRQFTAMEKAIQRANSQSAYLMNQFSM